MHERDLLPLLLATLLLAPLLARWAGLRVAAHLKPVPGQVRRWMPTLPELPQDDGTPAARFDAAIRRAEARAVPLLLAQARAQSQETLQGLEAVPQVLAGLEAAPLAAQLGVPEPVAVALLDDWRRRLPSRLRVTRNGRLLHDFPVAAIAGAVRSAWHAWPQRLLLFLAAVLANLGATWWVVAGVAVGVASLGQVWQAADDEARLWAAVGGVGALLAVFAVSQVGAWLVHLVSWRRSPRMAKASRPARDTAAGADGKGLPQTAEDDEDEDDADIDPESGERPDFTTVMARQKARTKAKARARTAAQVARKQLQPAKPAKKPKKDGGSWFDGLGLSLDIDGEGCMYLPLILAVSVLVAAVLGGLAVVGIWLRGLWRAAKSLGEPVRDLSPSRWLREARRAPVWERWVPTNDLAIRLVRALGRLLQVRPADDRLAGKVLARARAQGGRVSALDIALDHALDLGEAMSVGSRLVGQLGGDIHVSERGDLDFSLSPEALASANAVPDAPDLEYLQPVGEERITLKTLPVNVPGLTQDHVEGAARLAGGPYATVAVMAVALLGGRGDLPIQGLDLSLGALFCILAPGTLLLAAVTRQAVAESAAQGVLRDIRRLAVHSVQATLAQRGRHLDAEGLAAHLHATVARLGLGWTATEVQREVEAAWSDLGIAPEFSRHGPQLRWTTDDLQQRQASLVQLRQTGDRVQTDADEVVFDTGPFPAAPAA